MTLRLLQGFFVMSSFLIYTSFQASSSCSLISTDSTFSFRWSTGFSRAMQRSIKPFIVSTPCKNQNKVRNKGK